MLAHLLVIREAVPVADLTGWLIFTTTKMNCKPQNAALANIISILQDLEIGWRGWSGCVHSQEIVKMDQFRYKITKTNA